MTKTAARVSGFNYAIISRTLPFALFMAFIAVDESVRFTGSHGWLSLPPGTLYYLYPLKAFSVAALLYLYRNHYPELRLRDLLDRRVSLASCIVGVVTFILWIYLDWTVSVVGGPAGFDPALLPEGAIRFAMTAVRVAGAVLVVPVMEELFWRSFLLRYIVDPDFESVPIGRFTWTSFAVSSLLFGLEHHLFVAGVTAGIIYNVLLYKTRSLAQCVLAHAVTNLALAGYVLLTHNWWLW
ncbi:CAAX prenyl protease-related protein [Geomonas sp. RF6]|uniref:CAAX prenyl protease-related protein n=1 Tax=Geomonas sp. RF6 TaxID=2897342 RepID=UPI001E5F4EC7|nr:CAAX prenyl protease-related protein [Geomonas sp. RF6]UFS69098.1 CAAX prenyl protease-related protein [Geomonas sp. RF6]